jgi:uncharacterized membrane protein (DUF2068 family)
MQGVPPAVKKRAPALYLIIAIKLGKGLLLLLLAFGVYRLAGHDLVRDYQTVLHFLDLDPEREFFNALAAKLQAVSPANVYWLAGGTAFYSLFSLIEGIGLMFRASWAGWMAIGESGFFIPIEIFKLVSGFSTTVFIILLLNVWIVWYLLRNRHRLFRHHHPHAAPAPGEVMNPDI